MQPLFEHRLELAGHQTRVLELEGALPAVVLLHGFADSADTWRLTLDRLARAERAAIAVDLPGFGCATPMDDHEPILPQLDAFVDALVTHVAQESGPVVLVGNSLGGCLTLRAGGREGLPLAGLVPVSPAGLDHPRWFSVIERDPLVRTLLRTPVPLPEMVVKALVGNAFRAIAFARPNNVDRHVVKAFAGHHPTRDSIARFMATAHRMLPELHHPFELAQIGCPVLLVWGDRDRLVSHTGARHVVEAIPGAGFELISDCGHCPQIEAVDHFVALLLDFVGHERAQAA